MNNHHNVILFTTLVGVCAAITAVTSAQATIGHIFIVLPLVLMGISLFFAGYYAGLYRSKK